MSNGSKISPSFEPFLAEGDAGGKREAIVIYRSPSSGLPPPRGRLRQLQQRLDDVRERAAAQQQVQARISEGYLQESARLSPLGRELSVARIGAHTLPVISAEVTPETLQALDNQPDVVAVLPNQQIQLIQPKVVDYGELAREESADGVTWGLKQLDIPALWPTPREQTSTSR